MTRFSVLIILLTTCALAPPLMGYSGVAHAEDGGRGADVVPCELTHGPRRAVVEVLDAETVRLDDGMTVRLVGALAPRSPSSSLADTDWPPFAQGVAALREMVLGRSVRLRHDKARETRYGHRLAHLFVEPESGDGPALWVQEKMISDGHARVVSFPRTRACARHLLGLEAGARRQNFGLWAHAAYQVRSAARPEQLLGFAGSFQLVEGRVRHAERVGRRTYLNFGRRWRTDFTLVVEGRSHRLFDAGDLDLTTLVGARVRARGWIEVRNGPQIRLTHPEQLEILSRPRREPSNSRSARRDEARSGEE